MRGLYSQWIASWKLWIWEHKWARMLRCHHFIYHCAYYNWKCDMDSFPVYMVQWLWYKYGNNDSDSCSSHCFLCNSIFQDERRCESPHEFHRRRLPSLSPMVGPCLSTQLTRWARVQSLPAVDCQHDDAADHRWIRHCCLTYGYFFNY